ncbi:histidine phosphatase family protein [Chitinophaga sp. 212800010-3]|uniref:histidine phosphatase family protein n=1 Tax=unclassified Chitinophaga TaxID=2619133 RepID=UPI002DEED83F|nr:Histidine phosphatase family protein [Chitinophaga sp. 212800010-3]
MTRIAIIRHGTTSWNKEGRAQGYSDIPLDEEGLLQAAKLGQWLTGQDWEVIYSSHLIRARQTAAIIAQELSIDSVIQDERIGEAGGGLTEGTTEEDRIRKWGENWKQLDLGQESNSSVVGRGLSFMDDLLSTNNGKNIMIVTHGSFIRQMLDKLFPTMQPTPAMKNTSFTQLRVLNQDWTCEVFNSVTHLE